MAFNLSPRNGNFSKTGHGLPGGMIKSMPPLHQAKRVVDTAFRPALKKETSFFGSVINAALNPIDTAVALGSTISDYISGNTQSKPKPKVKTEKPTLNYSGEEIPTLSAKQSWGILSKYDKNRGVKVSQSDDNGNFTIGRGEGFTPRTKEGYDTQLNEKVNAYKGTIAGLKNIQESKDADVQSAVDKRIDYWQNPEVQRMYLNNNPEYKGDLKKAQQDINTHLALGANYEFVKSRGFSKQNKKEIHVDSNAAANTFSPGFNQSWLDKFGKKTEVNPDDISIGNKRDLRSKRGIIAYRPFDKNEEGADYNQFMAELGHEIDHATGFANRQARALGNILGDPDEQPGQDQRTIDSSITSEGKTYLSGGTEMYGKFKEYKDNLRLLPGQKVTREQLEALEKKYVKPGVGTFESLFDLDRKVKAINEVAQGGKKKSNLNFSDKSDKEGFKFTGNSNNSYA